MKKVVLPAMFYLLRPNVVRAEAESCIIAAPRAERSARGCMTLIKRRHLFDPKAELLLSMKQ